MGRTTPSAVSGWETTSLLAAGLAAAIEAAILLVALAALAELQPVRTLSARTPARSIRFLSFFISIPSSLSIIGISCLTCFALAQYTLVLGKSKLPT